MHIVNKFWGLVTTHSFSSLSLSISIFCLSVCHLLFLQLYLSNDISNAEQYDPEVCLGHLKRYVFKELRTATDHFSSKNILGSGGFGVVYKGRLNNGTVVAVKRLKDYNAVGGEIQFQTEVELISLAVHRNLLRLWGFCSTESERLLVYPYMPNGSVAARLKGQPLCLHVLLVTIAMPPSFRSFLQHICFVKFDLLGRCLLTNCISGYLSFTFLGAWSHLSNSL